MHLERHALEQLPVQQVQQPSALVLQSGLWQWGIQASSSSPQQAQALLMSTPLQPRLAQFHRA